MFGIKVHKTFAFSFNQQPNMLAILVGIASTEVDAIFALAIAIVTASALVICDVLKDPIPDLLFLAAYFHLRMMQQAPLISVSSFEFRS